MARVAESGRSREPYWRLTVARWKRSGLSARAFCRAEGVNESMFCWWRRELIRRDQTKPKTAFRPVRVVADKPEPSLGSVEIVLGNRRCVGVGVGFDPYTLVRVVHVTAMSL